MWRGLRPRRSRPAGLQVEEFLPLESRSPVPNRPGQILDLGRVRRVTARPLVLCVVFVCGLLLTEKTPVSNEMWAADDLENMASGE